MLIIPYISHNVTHLPVAMLKECLIWDSYQATSKHDSIRIASFVWNNSSVYCQWRRHLPSSLQCCEESDSAHNDLFFQMSIVMTIYTVNMPFERIMEISEIFHLRVTKCFRSWGFILLGYLDYYLLYLLYVRPLTPLQDIIDGIEVVEIAKCQFFHVWAQSISLYQICCIAWVK